MLKQFYFILQLFIYFLFIFSLSQVVKLIIALGILLTFSLQFYIPIVIMWPKVVKRFGPFQHPVFAELGFRTLLVLLTCKYTSSQKNYIQEFTQMYLAHNYFLPILIFISFSVTLAEVIPYLGLFISLVGAVSSTALALMFPPVLELAIRWSISDMAPLMVIKNIVIILIGVLGCVTGTYESIVAIVNAIAKGSE